MATRKKMLAHKSNYGGTRKASEIEYIVVHFTANDGDRDENNARYFQTPNRGASAHYFVDDDSITQSVPDLSIAWSVGGKRYQDCVRTGGGTLYGIARNANTLNIELCDTRKDGQFMATEKTMQNAAALIRELMKKYDVQLDNVIRHFDVTGKHCPVYFMKPGPWADFKARLTDQPAAQEPETAVYEVTAAGLNIRSGPGMDHPVVYAMTKGDRFTVCDTSGIWAEGTHGKYTGFASLKYMKKL